jgi:hypothetical protein
MPSSVQSSSSQSSSVQSSSGQSSWLRRRARLAPLLALATATATVGSVVAASPAHASGVEGPYTSFGYAKTFQGIQVQATMPQPAGESGTWETSVKVCNHSPSTIPVGPENFSYSRNQTVSFYFTKRATPVHAPLSPVQLAPGACVSGALATGDFQPYQLAFHQHRLGLTIDIVPATELEGTYEPSAFPKAVGATFFPGDYTGDHRADVLADKSGTISLYRTSGGPSLGWSSTVRHATTAPDRWMTKVGDLDSNGMTDVVIGTADGRLLLLRSMEGGRLALPYEIGRGWGSTSLFAVAPGNDMGTPTYLVARNVRNELVRYTLTARGLSGGAVVGTNWGAITKLVSPGDLTSDGRSDLVAVRTDGQLLRYGLGRDGRITSTAVIGRGWQHFTKLAAPGDLDGDLRTDLVGVRQDGGLFHYHSFGNGSFRPGQQIGWGWNGMDAIA